MSEETLQASAPQPQEHSVTPIEIKIRWTRVESGEAEQTHVGREGRVGHVDLTGKV